jgi:predicted short-subunit dehydrogenase-like oxidoreductase (DUF2520 family)
MAQREALGIAVIGEGNWGGSLIAGLRAAGVEPSEVIGRSGWRRARLDARVIWICVPDAAIAEVAGKIARRGQRLRGEHGLRGQIVLHSSGALSAEVLECARRAGAKIASVHPVMSFPTRRVVPLAGVMFGVEAREATATAWVRGLAEATVANVFARGAGASFSGPFARGDAETIHLHLQALAEHPILADVYRSLARHAVAVLTVKNHGALLKAIGSDAGGRTLK